MDHNTKYTIIIAITDVAIAIDDALATAEADAVKHVPKNLITRTRFTRLTSKCERHKLVQIDAHKKRPAAVVLYATITANAASHTVYELLLFMGLDVKKISRI